MTDELLNVLSSAVMRLKDGDYFERQRPKKWHYEEEDDYCECCGEYLGKKKVMKIDEWETYHEFFKLPDGGLDSLIIHPEAEQLLLGDDDG